MVYSIGITGSIGTGKSAVGKILQDKGIFVIDTDLIVHELLSNQSPLQNQVLAIFGKDILDESGVINRKKLGKIVFDDPQARKKLEAILHPAVLLRCREILSKQPSDSIAAILVPLLFEAKLEANYDEIWCIIANEEIIIERLKKRDNFQELATRKRLAAQMPQADKMKLSHRIIDNSGSLDSTKLQVDKALSLIPTKF